jgi:hypothetical protein
MSHISYKPQSIVDKTAMLSYLRNKKEDLCKSIDEIKSSYTYTVLSENKDFKLFMEEIRQQFEQRIEQLKKRTRIKKKSQ